MPTPRPEMSVTRSAVEKPGREISRIKSSSLSSVRDVSTRPRCRAFASTRSRSIPRPSSLTRIVIDGVAQEMNDGIADLVEHRPVELDLLPLNGEFDLLAEGPRGIAHESRKAIEHLPYRDHAAGHD